MLRRSFRKLVPTALYVSLRGDMPLRRGLIETQSLENQWRACTIAPALCLHSAAEVRESLTKTVAREELPSKIFVDEVGSALFEHICVYCRNTGSPGPTRGLLGKARGRGIVSRLPSPVQVAEIGSWAREKKRLDPQRAFVAAAEKDVLLPIEFRRLRASGCEKRRLGQIELVSIVGTSSRPGRIAHMSPKGESGAGSSAGAVSGQHHRQFRSRCGRNRFARNEGDSQPGRRITARHGGRGRGAAKNAGLRRSRRRDGGVSI